MVIGYQAVGIEIKNIVVIGSGNVAWHMTRAFGMKGIRILQILARNEKSAAKLSARFSVPYITDPRKLVNNADLYLLAVQDDNIGPTARQLGLSKQFLVHTSGFSSLSVLDGASSNTGVLWPLQTLTAGKNIAYSEIPFFIEANTSENTVKLSQFAGLVSGKVTEAGSATRQKAHLAAVIASNLANRLYAISASILEKEGLPFDLLAPLIMETARKAAKSHPLKSQTGPAARNDLDVISMHIDLLAGDPEFKEIYRLISENIIQNYHGKSE
jgi:predicted short-subunit dehydrogenase-like oxidoreductase (DUF2520 family)